MIMEEYMPQSFTSTMIDSIKTYNILKQALKKTMNYKKIHNGLFFVFISVTTLWSQQDIYGELQKSELSIPSAPAFALLGVNPETVLRPSDLKSFKVDWRVKNYNLAPDLALEAQPLWHFYYKKRSFSEYANASNFSRKISTLSLSLGTAKIDNLNHASYAIKLNLYKKNDLLNDSLLLHKINQEYINAGKSFNEKIDSLVKLRYKSNDPKRKEEIEREMDVVLYEKRALDQTSKQQLQNIIDEYNFANWNNTMLDIAFGSVYTYDNSAIDSLKVKKAGYALWLNGCLKMGDHGLLSGIFKHTQIADNANHLFGMSYRYGSHKYNFYIELVYEKLRNYFDASQINAFEEEEYFAAKYIEDLGSGWLNFNNTENRNQYTISYGGDFKLSRNILLNFALRTQFSDEIKLTRLLPVANIVCLMK